MLRKLNIWKTGGLVLGLFWLAACQVGPEPRIFSPGAQVYGTEDATLFVIPTTMTPRATPFAPDPTSTAAPGGTPSAVPVLTQPSATSDGTGGVQESFPPLEGTTETVATFSALNEGLPYLIYYGETNGQPEIVLLNTNLRGRRSLPMPSGSLPPHLPEALSPGKLWLAFHTDAPDQALYIMNLPSGQTQRIDSLPVADVMQWSPTGRYLAFSSGGERGAQSEVLLYDRWREAVYRLGGGNDPVLWLSWSPDNNYLLFANASAGCAGDCGLWTAVDIRTGRSWQPRMVLASGQQVILNGWDTPNVVSIVVRGGGKSVVKSFNISNNTEIVKLETPFENYRFHREANVYAVTADQGQNSDQPLEPGIYLYNPTTGTQQPAALFAEYGELRVTTFGRQGYSFLLWNEQQILVMDRRGAVSAAAQGTFRGLSPRGNWLAVVDHAVNPPVLYLMNDRFQAIYQASAEYAGELFWNEEETLLFSILAGKLYVLPIQTGEWVLVDAHLPENSYVWKKALLFAWK